MGPDTSVYKYLNEHYRREHGLRDDVLDTEWLRLVGEQGWLAITRDLQILEREVERRTLIESRARVIILRPGDALWSEMLEFLLVQIDWLRRIYGEVPPPFVCIAHIAEPVEQARFVDLSL